MHEELPVNVGSIYGAETRRGLVVLEIGDQKLQISPQDALRIAGMLREAAEAAQTDELIMRFFTRRVGLSLDQAANIMADFRRYRDRRQQHSPAAVINDHGGSDSEAEDGG